MVDRLSALSHLVDRLGEPQIQKQLLELTEHSVHIPAPRRWTGSSVRARREMGSVADAVLQVLKEAGTELSYIEIHGRVEQLLGGAVAKSSVKNALARSSQGRLPVLMRLSRGRYKLRNLSQSK